MARDPACSCVWAPVGTSTTQPLRQRSSMIARVITITEQQGLLRERNWWHPVQHLCVHKWWVYNGNRDGIARQYCNFTSPPLPQKWEKNLEGGDWLQDLQFGHFVFHLLPTRRITPPSYK